MARPVKCRFCKNIFDRDKEEYVDTGSNPRYAHKKCYDDYMSKKSQDERDYEALVSYVKKLLGDDYREVKVTRQIKDYKQNYDYSFSGMLKTLKWWYEVKGNSVDKANNGIGIIPWVYDDAAEYYFILWAAENNNENVEWDMKTQVIEIPSPSPQRMPPRLMRFPEEREED